jgi:acyl-CoA synthetase (AMP-forming)/AMP-acid ligase II
MTELNSRYRDLVRSDAQRLALEESGLWTAETLATVVDGHVARAPESIAVVDLEGRRSVTYRQLAEDSHRVAATLASRGVGTGDVVSVLMPNWYETVAIDLGVLRLGAVLNSLLPTYRSNDLSHIFDVAVPSVVIAPATYRSSNPVVETASAASKIGLTIPCITMGDPEPEVSALEAAFEEISYDLPTVAAGPVSQIIFTSGSESTPKGVMHSEQTTNFAVRRAAEFLGLAADVVVWMPSPIGHSTGFNYGVRFALLQGGRIVLQDRWEPDVAVSLCETQRANFTSVSPTFLRDVLDRLAERTADMTSLRCATVAGAPIPPGLVKEAEGHGIVVLRGYGSTETLGVSKTHPSDPESKRLTTEGRPVKDVQVEIRDPEGTALGTGVDGEIWVHTPGACFGFMGDPMRTSETFDRNGWARTGDLGTLDEEGFLTVTGRMKQIIIRGGMNITPREIEDLLLLNPAIARAAVVGLPDDRLGEVVCACIVTTDAVPPSFEEVVTYLKTAGLANYKLPERVEVFDRLPLTPTHKVDKGALTELLVGSHDSHGH